MNQIRKIAKNTAVLITGEIVSKVISLFLIVYIARYLGDVGLGKYSFALAFTGLFAIITNSGLETILIRDGSRNKTNLEYVTGSVSSIRVFLSLVTTILIFISINLLEYPQNTKFVVYIFGISVIFNGIASVLRSVFNAVEQMKYVTLTTMYEKVFTSIAGVLALFMGYGLIGLALTMLAGSIFGFMVSFYYVARNLMRPRLVFSIVTWKYLFKESMPLMLAGLFVSILTQIDTVMLSLMKGDQVVGWYNAAYRMVNALGFIPVAFLSSIFPMMSRSYATSHESLRAAAEKSYKYLLIIALPLAFGTTILADKLIWTLYESQFTQSIIALQILIWATALSFLILVIGIVLISINKQIVNMYLSGISAVLNVILNLALIPVFSYKGAAIATVISSMFIFLGSIYFVQKDFPEIKFFKILIRPLIGCVIMSIFLIYFRSYSLIVLIPLGATAYFSTLLFIKTISAEDIRIMKMIFSK